jgi:hypothetical protein
MNKAYVLYNRLITWSLQFDSLSLVNVVDNLMWKGNVVGSYCLVSQGG